MQLASKRYSIKYNRWPTCMCIKKPTKNKPAIITTLIYSQCLLIPIQNSPVCVPYFANLFGEPHIGTLLYRTKWQRRPTDIHLWRWKALQPPPPPTRGTQYRRTAVTAVYQLTAHSLSPTIRKLSEKRQPRPRQGVA